MHRTAGFLPILHHNLCEYGSLRGNKHSEKGLQVTQTPSFEENMLNIVPGKPKISVLAIAVAVEESRSSVHRVLKHEGLRPYHLQRAPSLPPINHSARERWTVVTGSVSPRSAFPILRLAYE